MDARIGTWVVTPRMGKPVEIQALWYNALCIYSELFAIAAIKRKSCPTGFAAVVDGSAPKVKTSFTTSCFGTYSW